MSEEFIEDILAETGSSGELKKSAEETVDAELDAKPNGASDADSVSNAAAEIDVENKIDIKSEAKSNPEPEAIQTDLNNEPEVTIEDLATQIGWNANYQGENSVDAATYILKSREIQDTMKSHNVDLKNQLSDVKNSINDLKSHNDRIYQIDIKRRQTELDSLKKQKHDAVELADVNKVNELDKQIDDIQKDLAKPEPEKAATTNPVFDEWVKENQWYLTDAEMATYAETIAEQYDGAPLDRLYKIVEQKVMEIFPEKFKNKETSLNNKKATLKKEEEKPIGPKSPVEGVKNSPAKANFTKADLTPDQTVIMNQFAKLGVMTEEQYIKDIVKMQEEG